MPAAQSVVNNGTEHEVEECTGMKIWNLAIYCDQDRNCELKCKFLLQ